MDAYWLYHTKTGRQLKSDMDEWATVADHLPPRGSNVFFAPPIPAEGKRSRRKKLMEEGGRCPKCLGIVQITQDTCYCAASNMPPCGSCENSWLECVECGLTDEDYDKEKNMLFKITVDGKDVYGNQLAIGSDGLAIFEERGTSTIHKVLPSAIEEVLPYTVGIKYAGNSTLYHYYAIEGDVKVGDFLLKTDGTKGVSIATVMKIGTKSRAANKFFEGVKLATTPLRGENLGADDSVVED